MCAASSDDDEHENERESAAERRQQQPQRQPTGPESLPQTSSAVRGEEGGLVGHWRCSLIIALPVCVLSVRVYLPTAAADAAAATASDGAHCEKPR